MPSIEDKIIKFASRDAHHVFIEPEGRDNIRLYPKDSNIARKRANKNDSFHQGMENAEIIRPGYAIEYDFADHTTFSYIRDKKVEGLFFAGQLNGTTGYEGIMSGFVSGVNAALKF